MGDTNVANQTNEEDLRRFTLAVLNDLQAIEQMLEAGHFENDKRRIGAEQEMFLIDSAMRPAPLALEIIEAARDDRLTTEIGRFNLEANLTPLDFSGDCLSRMERELNEVLAAVRGAARKFDADLVLTGILPTVNESDLIQENLTPLPRYKEFDRVINKLQGGSRLIQIKGLDELQITREDVFIEFCNTSFQIHLQVPISEFVRHYNWAQAIAAPVLAPAVNSPVLLGHRLWHETRLALFQHATDTRSAVHAARSQPARVNFGDDWVQSSMLEVFREDAARFRIILTQEIEENSLETLARGEIPELAAWRLHNGTIWRWNRACYGTSDNRASLRIEARFLPAGPTVADEMANAAFFLGLMTTLPEEFGDVPQRMPFDAAKNNFYTVARYGLKSQLDWLDGRSYAAQELISSELLLRAREGLRAAGIDSGDADRLLGIVEERVAREKTGAQWMLDSLAAMDERAKPNVKLRTLTAAMKANQEAGALLHDWELAEIPAETDWIDNYQTIEQFMATDLFTVRPEDAMDLAANVMHWRHLRHVPVEDDAGHLVGIVTRRDLLGLLVRGKLEPGAETVVRDVMKSNPITVGPETATLDALKLMRENDIGCLPVVKDGKLVGIVTAHDFLTVSTKLLEERLKAI